MALGSRSNRNIRDARSPSRRALQKRRLLRALWGDVVVDENGLNQHISALRRLVGERPGDNRFIVTVPGCGHLFVAPVMPPAPSNGPARAISALLVIDSRDPLRAVS
jgi:DNA-binding winged helix-turn-helix (wHTH) protein